MNWEKVDNMGMPVGNIYVNGQYLYVATDNGVYRLLVEEIPPEGKPIISDKD